MVTICIFPATTAVAVSLIELLLSSTRFVSTHVVAERKCFHVGAVDIREVDLAGETDGVCHDDDTCRGVGKHYICSPIHLVLDGDSCRVDDAHVGRYTVGGGLYSDEGEFDRATHDVVPSQRRCVVFIPHAGPHRELCWETLPAGAVVATRFTV